MLEVIRMKSHEIGRGATPKMRMVLDNGFIVIENDEAQFDLYQNHSLVQSFATLREAVEKSQKC